MIAEKVFKSPKKRTLELIIIISFIVNLLILMSWLIIIFEKIKRKVSNRQLYLLLSISIGLIIIGSIIASLFNLHHIDDGETIFFWIGLIFIIGGFFGLLSSLLMLMMKGWNSFKE